MYQNLHDIIKGCQGGNEKAQKNLYENYYGLSLKIVFRYIYHFENAREVVHDGFVKIYTKIHLFTCDDISKIQPRFYSWLKTIMVHTAIDALRKNKLLPEIGILTDAAWLKDDAANAADMLFYKELIVQVKKLPPGYRIVFNMFVIDGYSHKEISIYLGISEGASKSNLFKARGILQDWVKKAEEEKCYM
ncbi:MAG: RNA polymerase sigma factor [Ferruginibacter sp.]